MTESRQTITFAGKNIACTNSKHRIKYQIKNFEVWRHLSVRMQPDIELLKRESIPLLYIGSSHTMGNWSIKDGVFLLMFPVDSAAAFPQPSPPHPHLVLAGQTSIIVKTYIGPHRPAYIRTYNVHMYIQYTYIHLIHICIHKRRKGSKKTMMMRLMIMITMIWYLMVMMTMIVHPIPLWPRLTRPL